MNASLDNIVFVLIIFQLLFISLFLFTRQKGKGGSNILLGCFFLAIALNLLDIFLLMTGVYFLYPAIAGWGTCLPLLFGPLLYFYTQSVTLKNFSISLKKLPHFLPFALVFIATSFYYLGQSRNKEEQILRDIDAHHLPAAITLVSTFILLQFIFYAIRSLRLVSAYRKAANQLFSGPKQTNVSWLYRTIIFFMLIMVITTLNGWLSQTAYGKYYLVAFMLVVLAVLIFVMQVLMKALGQSQFFTVEDDLNAVGSAPQKVTLNPLERTEREAIVQSVLKYMETSKPYLEPELSLEQLASQISLKPRVLSQAINEVLNQNFFDFINRFRIEEAQRLLTNPADKKITVLEVLYRVGFNSKSSFNNLFKKYTGLTPTEFKEKQSL